METPLLWYTQSYRPCYIKVCVLHLFLTYLILRKIYTNHNFILLQRRFTPHVTEGVSLCIRAVKRNDGVCCNSLTRSWYSNPSLHGNVAFYLHKEQAICKSLFFFFCVTHRRIYNLRPEWRNLILVQITGSVLCLSNIQPLSNQFDCYFPLFICLSNIQPIRPFTINF